MTITERLFLILAKSGKTQKELSSYIDVNEKTVSAWKKNNSLPPADKLSDISDFLSVSVDYLLCGKESKITPMLSAEESEILRLFRLLSPVQQGRLIERAAVMSEQNENDALNQEKVS